ncbi:MAG: TonB-dependent receptor, partial [Bacteroidales bacterium]|nr:TonB-dependent receptor [Bacteroidales bacterium]
AISITSGQKNVSGNITDENGERMVGVTIYLKGTSNGTISDMNGNYVLTGLTDASTLVFSYVGYHTIEFVVGDQQIVNVQMEPDIMNLEEVVLVGYGVQKKSHLTGSVASVNAEDMQKIEVASVAEALQGRASGVYVTRSSGAPGSGASIYVRGPGSVNNTEPLWVIDGIPSSSGNHLNTKDIESVEILKDASAAAIYGARAANGVILVTTKRGKIGKPTISFTGSYGFTQPMNLPDLVNSETFAKLRHESYLNGNFQAGLNQIYTKIVNNPDTLKYLPDTDWNDVLYKNGALKNYNLEMAGGNEYSNFFISLGYMKEEGTFIRSSFERFTATINSDHKINKWIKVGESLNLSQTANRGRLGGFNAAMRVNPFMEVLVDQNSVDHPYTPYGLLSAEYGFMGPNPYGAEDISERGGKDYRINGNMYVDIQPISGLSWKTTVGGYMNMGRNRIYTVPYYLAPTLEREFDRLNIGHSDNFGLIGNSILNYIFSIKNHSIELMTGAEIQDNTRGYSYSMQADDFSNNLIVFNQADPLTYNLRGEDRIPTRWISQFGRINYAFADKYLFTFNVRRDGSSIFSPGSRIGVFPSFSAGWRVTKEPFMQGLASLMDLKLRFGWGGVGNPSVAPFSYETQFNSSNVYYVFGNDILQLGAMPSVFGVGNLTWETVYTTNFGIDINMLENRLSITNEFYIKDTEDMLIGVDLPMNAGMGTNGSTAINAGEIRNIGNDFSVQYRDQAGAFKYNLGGNLSFNRHTVLNLVGNEINMGELIQFRTVADQPMSYYWGFEVDGIWQEDELEELQEFLIQSGRLTAPEDYNTYNYTAPGDLKFRDLSGPDGKPDGLINEYDRVNIGNPWPKFVYGFNLSTEYKGFDLSAFFQGVYGNDIYHLNKRATDNLEGDYSFTYDALNRWTPENPNNEQPRIVYSDPNFNMRTSSSYFVEKGSYLRLKNIQLGYTLPASIMSKLKIDDLRIYVSGQNILTLTNYSGSDPEISTGSNVSKNLDEGIYPQSRTILFGIQLTL